MPLCCPKYMDSMNLLVNPGIGHCGSNRRCGRNREWRSDDEMVCRAMNSNMRGSSAWYDWKSIRIFDHQLLKAGCHDVSPEQLKIFRYLINHPSHLTWNATWDNLTIWTRCDIAFWPYTHAEFPESACITIWCRFKIGSTRENWIQNIQYQVFGDAIWRELELDTSRLTYCVVGRLAQPQVESRVSSLIW